MEKFENYFTIKKCFVEYLIGLCKSLHEMGGEGIIGAYLKELENIKLNKKFDYGLLKNNIDIFNSLDILSTFKAIKNKEPLKNLSYPIWTIDTPKETKIQHMPGIYIDDDEKNPLMPISPLIHLNYIQNYAVCLREVLKNIDMIKEDKRLGKLLDGIECYLKIFKNYLEKNIYKYFAEHKPKYLNYLLGRSSLDLLSNLDEKNREIFGNFLAENIANKEGNLNISYSKKFDKYFGFINDINSSAIMNGGTDQKTVEMASNAALHVKGILTSMKAYRDEMKNKKSKQLKSSFPFFSHYMRYFPKYESDFVEQIGKGNYGKALWMMEHNEVPDLDSDILIITHNPEKLSISQDKLEELLTNAIKHGPEPKTVRDAMLKMEVLKKAPTKALESKEFQDLITKILKDMLKNVPYKQIEPAVERTARAIEEKAAEKKIPIEMSKAVVPWRPLNTSSKFGKKGKIGKEKFEKKQKETDEQLLSSACRQKKTAEELETDAKFRKGSEKIEKNGEKFERKQKKTDEMIGMLDIETSAKFKKVGKENIGKEKKKFPFWKKKSYNTSGIFPETNKFAIENDILDIISAIKDDDYISVVSIAKEAGILSIRDLILIINFNINNNGKNVDRIKIYFEQYLTEEHPHRQMFYYQKNKFGQYRIILPDKLLLEPQLKDEITLFIKKYKNLEKKFEIKSAVKKSLESYGNDIIAMMTNIDPIVIDIWKQLKFSQDFIDMINKTIKRVEVIEQKYLAKFLVEDEILSEIDQIYSEKYNTPYPKIAVKKIKYLLKKK